MEDLEANSTPVAEMSPPTPSETPRTETQDPELQNHANVDRIHGNTDDDAADSISSRDRSFPRQTEEFRAELQAIREHIRQQEEAYVQNAREVIKKSSVNKTEYQKVERFERSYDDARRHRKSGKYEFCRFRNMHLLSLSLYQDEIGSLESDIRKLIERLKTRKSESRESGSRSLYYTGPVEEPPGDVAEEESIITKEPSEILEAKMARVRELLKAHSEEMICLDMLMQLKTGSETDYAELNHQVPMDPVRSFLIKIIIWYRDLKVKLNGRKSRNLIYAGSRRLAGTIARFIIGILGGASLIVPMILMTFLTTRNEHLIITSVFTFAFAFGISFASTATNQEVLGATAAYAAVLVVFVGTSSPPT